MRNVRMLVAYDGSRFFGWQRQDGFESIQETIEDAFESFLGASVVVHGAGRTDTGVHALGQVAHAHVDTRLDDERLTRALNAHLPHEIRVRALETCRPDFHARFDAVGKRYLYLVWRERDRSPFAVQRAHHVRDALDVGRMREAARHAVGRHDFAALASAGSPRSSSVRTITSLRLVVRRDRLAFVVQGDGFLYNMVRTLVGSLLDVGRGRTSPAEFAEILASRDRRRAGPTAPAAGLYLCRVRYGEPLFAAARRP
jgi:tRNA pseudouridine38-40 synthase